MITRLTIYFTTLAALMLAIGCSSSPDQELELTYSSTQVKSFSLVTDNDVLNNLDSVFFSIDLVNARIFNADSMPYGTNVSALRVNLTTDACSAIELKFKSRYTGADTTVNYINSSTEPINFASGPVTLHLVSFDKQEQRDYQIKVNVHCQVPDSLYWNEVQRRPLPSNLPVVAAQKTTRKGATAYCLTSTGEDWCIASTDDPGADRWDMITPAFGFTPKALTFEATDDALYILSTTGNLYRSADGGRTWSATGQSMTHIYGCYGTKLLGVTRLSDGSLHHCVYSHPSFTVTTAEVGDCPVSGTSQAVTFDSKWSTAPQLTLLGGRKANGEITNASWGYDGNTWAQLSENFPVKVDSPTLISYIITSTDTVSWRTDRQSALLAFGGLKPDGTVNDDVYVSRDFGMNWRKGSDNLQLPAYLPASFHAQALVYDSTITDNDASTLAVKPITEWTAPYIYLFGGYDAAHYIFPYLWRGAINTLTYKPLQ